MFDNVTAAADAISDALEGVPGVRHYRQMDGAVDPPATVLPLPALRWGSMEPEPTDASWVVALVVDRGPREQEQLLALLPGVISALSGVVDVVVGNEVRPGKYPAGAVQLPSFLIDLEVAL